MEITVKEITPFDFSEQEPFLAFPPYFEEAFEDSKKNVLNKNYERSRLVQILTEYNQSINNDECALKNIQQLEKKETVCVVSGQQAGFMGGPSYTILKGLSCLLLAREKKAIPIFWLATEDHDLQEVDHTFLIDSLGNLKEFKIRLGQNRQHQALEHLKFTAKHKEAIEEFLKFINIDSFEIPFAQNYATVNASFLAYLFKGSGLIFLEPKILRPLGKSFFQKEIERAEDIYTLLKENQENLLKQGLKAPLPIEKAAQFFIFSEDQKREKVDFDQEGFKAGNKKYKKEELLSLLEKQPERFSTNAKARPLVQSAVLPVAAYIAGPNELNYFRQLKEYFAFHQIPMPWVLPRLSATFITTEGEEILKKLKLKPENEIPIHWSELFKDVQKKLETLQTEWKNSGLKIFSEDFSEKNFETQIKYQLEKIEKKIIHKKLQSLAVPSFGLHYLRNLIHPHNHLQERVLNFCTFQRSSTNSFILKLLEKLKWNIKGHLFILPE